MTEGAVTGHSGQSDDNELALISPLGRNVIFASVSGSLTSDHFLSHSLTGPCLVEASLPRGQ